MLITNSLPNVLLFTSNEKRSIATNPNTKTAVDKIAGTDIDILYLIKKSF